MSYIQPLSNRPINRRFFIFFILTFTVILGSWVKSRWAKVDDDTPIPWWMDRNSWINILFKKRSWLITSIVWLSQMSLRLKSFDLNKIILLQGKKIPLIYLESIIFMFSQMWWAFCVYGLFADISERQGLCHNHLLEGGYSERIWKEMCEAVNGNWIGFDISGHTFLCGTALTLVGEELILASNNWKMMRADAIQYVITSLSVVVCFVLYCIFTVTCFKYHTFGEKITGLYLSFGFWAIVMGIRRNLLYKEI